MEDAWCRIAAWFEANVPGGLHFRSGASPVQIKAVESRIGLDLPEDVRRSYRIHDGSNPMGTFCEDGCLLSLEEMARIWEELFKPPASVSIHGHPTPIGPIKPVWWNAGWIPLTESGGGPCLCIDMDPDQGGSVGQVIRFWHEVGPMRVEAQGLGPWLVQYAADLTAGKYHLDHDGEISRIDQ